MSVTVVKPAESVKDSSASPFWGVSGEALLDQLKSSKDGLTGDEAARRLKASAALRLDGKQRAGPFVAFLSQFKSPVILLLLFAAGLSLFLGDRADALIIFFIVFASGLLGFYQENGATNAVEKLLAVVQTKTSVRRDGKTQEVTSDQVVPGDIVLLSAGEIIPGDCAVLESNVLTVDEAALTGETFPTEKTPGTLPAQTGLSQRTNCVYMGTHAVSGSGTAVVVHIGKETQFGAVSAKLQTRPVETEFEAGVRRFGYLLMQITFVLVVAVFAVPSTSPARTPAPRPRSSSSRSMIRSCASTSNSARPRSSNRSLVAADERRLRALFLLALVYFIAITLAPVAACRTFGSISKVEFGVPAAA